MSFFTGTIVSMDYAALNRLINLAVSSRHAALYFLHRLWSRIGSIRANRSKITLHQRFNCRLVGFIVETIALCNLDTLNCRLNICHGDYLD